MVAQPVRNVIIVGGGGNLGQHVLNALISDGSFHVSVLSRHSSKSTFPSSVKVLKIADGYPLTELVEAFTGQDAVVSLIGPTHALQQIPMIDAAKKAGVRLFLPAEYGVNKENPRTAAHPVFGNKKKILDHLKASENEEFGWIGIATGPFFDWGLQTGFLGFDFQSRKALLWDSGEARWSATTLPMVSLAVAKTLHQPAGMKNQFVFVSSVTTSQKEVLSRLEKVMGEKWEVEYTTTDAAVKEGHGKMAEGDMSGVVPVMLATTFQDGWGADFTEEPQAASRLDLPEEDLESLVRSVVVG